MTAPKQPCVYIMASKRNGALYVGMTGQLKIRVWQHKEGTFEGWSQAHNTTMLVWYEMHKTFESAIRREKVVKRWKRAWKLNLIESMNPEWNDLAETL